MTLAARAPMFATHRQNDPGIHHRGLAVDLGYARLVRVAGLEEMV